MDGGFNAKAVEAMFQIGGKFVWLPTVSFRYERELLGGTGGISCLDEEGCVVPELVDILKLIADADGILATGHISAQEGLAVLQKGKELGIRTLIATHADNPADYYTKEERKLSNREVS